MRRMRFAMLGLLGWLIIPLAAPACPFCTMSGETMLGLADQANLVVFGSLKETTSTNDPNDPAAGKSILVIESIIKPNPDFKGTTLEINRFFDPELKAKYKFVWFCEVLKDKKKVDPYQAVASPSGSNIAEYIKGALALPKEPVTKRLRFFFDYLDNKDQEVSIDAYKEFGNSDYKDVKLMAVDLPPEKITGWITASETPAFRLGLYSLLLGHAGQKDPEKYSQVLVNLLEDKKNKVLSGVDGILTGYILLKPKDGWTYLCNILKDPKREFALRYSALRAARFFWEYRPDVIAHKEIITATLPMLTQEDVADLAIEDLRKWGAWEQADMILAVEKSPAVKLPIVRRALIRYALAATPHVPAAKAFIEAERKRDAGLVADAEELLRLEQPTPPKKDK